MESRSGRPLSRSPPPDGPGSRRLAPSSDRISALYDDMILLILSRLGSVRAAARTGLLSRRWRGLWTRIADLAFCADDAADKILAALARFSDSPPLSSVHVRLPVTQDPTPLLRAAALLSPAELVFVLKEDFRSPYRSTNVVLPCFQRATCIELDLGLLSIIPPAAGEFSALEKLSLAGHIPDLGSLLGRCPRLRVLGVTFRGVSDLGSLEAALVMLEAAGAEHGLVVPFLGVDTRRRSSYAIDEARYAPLLHAMARLSPQKVVFTDDYWGRMDAALPCFHRATTSIEMNLRSVCFATVSDVNNFSALENFSLSRNCSIVDLDALLSRCPRLRVLKVTLATGDVTVHSASLQDLEVRGDGMECHSVDIAAPMLKRLGLTVDAGSGKELSVSISAPILENVSWKLWYTTSALMFGFWHLDCARLESRQDQDMCIHALCLLMSPIARGRMAARPNFEKEMDKLLITDFSVLDLSLHTCGHVYGALVLRVLGTDRIRAATEKLKIDLLPSPLDKHGLEIICSCVKLHRPACPGNCPCGKRKNWRSQSISLPRLEEVEIDGFNGEDHERVFLEFISKCSPMLKRVTLKQARGFRGCTTKIYNSFLASPSVKCYVYSNSGELVKQPSCQHAP